MSWRFLLLSSLAPVPAVAGVSVCPFVYQQPREPNEDLSPRQRARLVCDLKAALVEKYALRYLKEERLGVALPRQLDACAKRELRNRDSDLVYPGFDVPRLEWEDHLQECLAVFQDTHLSSRAQTERPFVYAGLTLALLAGKVRVASVSRLVSSTWDPRLRERVVPGAVVLRIDGESPVSRARALARFIPGSSAAYSFSEGLRSVTERNFAYPLRPGLLLELEGGLKVRIPWWSVGLNQRKDTRELFARVGIRSAHSLALDFETRRREGSDSIGFAESSPLPSGELATFYDDQGRLGLRMGFLRSRSLDLCYIQLLTFSTRRWRPGSPAARPFSFEQVLGQQLAICRDSRRPLILDLRWNNGGEVENPSRLLALLARSGESYASTAISGLMTPHFRSVLEKYELGDGFPAGEGGTAPERMREALRTAERRGGDYLPFVLSPSVSSSLKGGAYDLPVIALTGPHCASACDLMAQLLRTSGRATLLGSPSNGTGGRFLEIGAFPKAGWSDELFGTVSVSIPNSLHAVPLKKTAATDWLFDFDRHRDWVMENKAVPVDVEYRTGIRDLHGGGAGWLEAAESLLTTGALAAP